MLQIILLLDLVIGAVPDSCGDGEYQFVTPQSRCKLCTAGHFCTKLDPLGTQTPCPEVRQSRASSLLAPSLYPYFALTLIHFSFEQGTYNPSNGSASVSACLICPAVRNPQARECRGGQALTIFTTPARVFHLHTLLCRAPLTHPLQAPPLARAYPAPQ